MKLHRFLAGIAMLLMLPMLCLPVFAAGAMGTLNLKCSTHINGERYYFSGDEFSILKIADASVITENGQASISYTTLPEYSEFDCDWGKLTAEEAHEKAKALEKLGTPAGGYNGTAVIDASGNASFAGLEEALYLVVRTKAALSNQAYSSEPFLVSIPLLWDGELQYVVSASPKYGWTPPVPDKPSTPDTVDPEVQVTPTKPASNALKLPQTGQLNWPVPILLLAGGLLILIGWKQYNQKQDK